LLIKQPFRIFVVTQLINSGFNSSAMKSLYIFILTIFYSLNTFSQNSQHKIKVYLLGTFHFNQTDTLKYDVRDEKHQKSIQKLSDIIAGLAPDKIFIERMPEFEYRNNMDSLYREYCNGKLSRARNEIWQVAARTAKKLNHKRLYQCDQPGRYGMYYSMLEDYGKVNGQLEALEKNNAKGMTVPITSTVDIDSLMYANDLLETLRWWNSKEVQQTSQAHYLNVYPQLGNTNAYTPADVADSTYFMGAELTADWYRRNIIIYSKMISQLDYSEKAIFLIIGNDHIPVIRHCFSDNPYFEVADTEQWLGKSKINHPK
jgi:hypothetical protein